MGAFGFLSLDDESLGVAGNAGLKDQRLAMKFVKSNIENFGGDPEKVCCFGHSAGGSSVSWHCISESSKGLFQRAVIMSGCVLNSWSLTTRLDWAYRLASKLGYQGNEKNEMEILEFLQNLPGEEIVKGQMTQLIKPEEMKLKISFPFAPCIEPYVNENTFISQKPIELLKDAWSNNIDVMIGGTSFEGLMFLQNIQENPAHPPNFKLESAIPTEIGLSSDNPLAIEFVKNLRKIYYSSSFLSTASSFGLSHDELAYCKVCIIFHSPHYSSVITDSSLTLEPISHMFMFVHLSSLDKNRQGILAWSSENCSRSHGI
jgi:cholinesterase